jgi:hypothetical protein
LALVEELYGGFSGAWTRGGRIRAALAAVVTVDLLFTIIARITADEHEIIATS